MASASGFPSVPAKAEVDELARLFDGNILLPAVVKKKMEH